MTRRVLCMSLLGMALGCTGAASSGGAETEAPGEATAAGASPGVAEGEIVGEAAEVGRELPMALVAELRRVGDDADGRLLTLAPAFIATVECSDCGAPSYLRFVAVRCIDETRCEVLTESCEGSVSKAGAETFEVGLRPVEGLEVEAGLCESYSGSFEVQRGMTQ